MANEEKRKNIGACHLVTINFPSATYRLITSTGYVKYSGNNYYSKLDDGLQILGLGALTEDSSGVSNRDLQVIQTSAINTYIRNLDYMKATVTLQEGERNPQTDIFTPLGTATTWEVGAFVDASFIDEPITFVLKSNLVRILEPSDALTTSSSCQSELVTATDTGFDYISGITQSSIYSNGGSYPINGAINYSGIKAGITSVN